jgi:large subunit ribosomal protein L13
MKTFTATPDDISHDWHVVDAAGVPLGRLASVVAQLIRGKHKPTFTPNADIGDFVIVVNAEKVKLTGKKMTDKLYRHHSQYMGGLKETTPAKVLQQRPERLVEWAVRGMLPKNKLGDRLFTKLKVYAGPEHPHRAQRPAPLAVNE